MSDIDVNPGTFRASLRCTKPVSFAQRCLWLIHQFEPMSTEYHVSRALRVRGQPDVEVLRRAFEIIAERHEVLRTTFDTEHNEPVQVIASAASPTIITDDLSGAAEPESRLLAEMTSALDEPIDLRTGPLWRIHLWRLTTDESVLMVVLHHIICDGSSIRILFREVSKVYADTLAGVAPSLPALRLQYGDWAAARRDGSSDGRLRDDLLFWKEQLEGAPPVLSLATDRPRRASMSRIRRGRRIPFVFPPRLSARLREVGREERVTSFMILLTAFQVLLARYAHVPDVVVGVPVLGRTSIDTEPLIGMFVNTLAVRADMRSAPSFRSLMMQVRARLLDAYARQDVPLEHLAGNQAADRSPDVHPVFQVLFTMHNLPKEKLTLAGCEVSGMNLDVVGDGSLRCRTTTFDLRMDLTENDDGVIGSVGYRVDLFDAETIQRFVGHYLTLLANVFTDLTRSVMHIPMITDEERVALIRGVVPSARATVAR